MACCGGERLGEPCAGQDGGGEQCIPGFFSRHEGEGEDDTQDGQPKVTFDHLPDSDRYAIRQVGCHEALDGSLERRIEESQLRMERSVVRLVLPGSILTTP